MTNEQKIAEQKFGGKTIPGWVEFINVSLKKTVAATLDSAKRIAAFKEAVSDDVFKEVMKTSYGFTASHISYWNKISENLSRFEQHIQILPSSPRSLYELSAIDSKVFDELVASGKIKPSLTVESIKELKASGGKIKSFILKYSESHDYLEICRKSDELSLQDLTAEEHIKALATWIKENKITNGVKLPKATTKPEVIDEDEDMADYPVVTPKVKVGELMPAMSREYALQLFGVYLDKPLDNMAIERALIAQAGDDESLQRALEVILK